MASGPTKYDQILEYVRDRIISGEFAPGDRLPSDGQLVKMFSSSRPTVAKAMHDLEKEGYLERRVGSGSYVRVKSNTQAILIGKLLPEFGRAEIFEPICTEIQSQCKKHNMSLIRTEWTGNDQSDENMKRQLALLCASFIEQGVAGVFFAPVEFSEHMQHVNRNIVQRFDEAGIAVVLLDRGLERLPGRSQFDLVGVDNFRIGMIQTTHFIKSGQQRIAYVSREGSAPMIDLRIAGYRQALQDAGIDFDPKMILTGNAETPEFVTRIKDLKATAVVCSNDATTVLLLESLQSQGVEVPRDIKLIGVDDVKLAAGASVPLTTIRQPCQAIGSVATQTMITRIENRKMAARTISLDVTLVIRESCGSQLANKSAQK